jgi:hypothetical protein
MIEWVCRELIVKLLDKDRLIGLINDEKAALIIDLH